MDKEELKKLQCTCAECGKLIPEVRFWYGSREYTFICTSIRDKEGNVVAETDFKLLEKYYHAMNTGQKKVGY